MKRDEVIQYIQEARFGYLATVSAEGGARVRPMGIHTVYGDNLYFFTFGSTRKVREVEQDPRVEVVWSKNKEQSQVRITGTVAVEDDEAVIVRFREDNPMVARVLPKEAQHLFRLYRLEPETVEAAEGLVPYSQVSWRPGGEGRETTCETE